MPIERKEIEKLYLEIEEARMHIWEIIYSPSGMFDDNYDPVDHHDMITTEVHPDYVKITVKDILPRIAGLKKSSLENHWAGIMHYALRDLNVKFDKVLCVIKVYNPADYWDTDNRAYNIIINSLRYNKIIPDDRHKYLSFAVIGAMDYENPRTEIYIAKHPENELFFIENNDA